jgi:hypothetical protein
VSPKTAIRAILGEVVAERRSPFADDVVLADRSVAEPHLGFSPVGRGKGIADRSPA